MKIATLENVSLPDILTVFNRSFADYMVRIELGLPQLKEKMRTEQVDLSISVGAFEQGKLVGFILHASRTLAGKKTFYNGGTGVVPAARGEKLATRMYAFILPILKAKGYEQGLLEVIVGNDPAIKTYERVGFSIWRELPCFRGEVVAKQGSQEVVCSIADSPDWALFASFGDWAPTWQNQTQTLQAQPRILRTAIARRAADVVAYLVYDPQKNRIKQLGVHPAYRRRGVGTALVQEFLQGRTATITNVDGQATAIHAFLKSLGMKEFLRQYEMRIVLYNRRM